MLPYCPFRTRGIPLVPPDDETKNRLLRLSVTSGVSGHPTFPCLLNQRASSVLLQLPPPPHTFTGKILFLKQVHIRSLPLCLEHLYSSTLLWCVGQSAAEDADEQQLKWRQIESEEAPWLQRRWCSVGSSTTYALSPRYNPVVHSISKQHMLDHSTHDRTKKLCHYNMCMYEECKCVLVS